MGQFAQGRPYLAGQQQVTAGGEVQLPPIQKQTAIAVNQGTGQVVIFGPFEADSLLLYARVQGPFGSTAQLYIGIGDTNTVLNRENLESSTQVGGEDEASWEHGLPIPLGWSVGIYWNENRTYGQAIGHIKTQQVAQ